MHGRVMIEVKVGKGKHKPHDSEGFGPILHTFRRFKTIAYVVLEARS